MTVMERVLEYIKANVFVTLTSCTLIGILGGYSFCYYRGFTQCAVEMLPTDDETLPMSLSVDVSGAVASPGIVTLDAGARVGEAIYASGGIISDAAAVWVAKNLNLAAALTDAAKIYVPFEWELYTPETLDLAKLPDAASEELPQVTPAPLQEQSAQTVQQTQTKTNVNTASAESLDALPGVGPSYAARIVDGRPYSDLSDFISRSGVPETTIEKFVEQISF